VGWKDVLGLQQSCRRRGVGVASLGIRYDDDDDDGHGHGYGYDGHGYDDMMDEPRTDTAADGNR
jgi:hypothetical protein